MTQGKSLLILLGLIAFALIIRNVIIYWTCTSYKCTSPEDTKRCASKCSFWGKNKWENEEYSQ